MFALIVYLFCHLSIR